MNPSRSLITIILFTITLLQLGKHLECDENYTTNPHKQEIPSTAFSTPETHTPRYVDMYINISKFGKKKNWNLLIPSRKADNSNLIMSKKRPIALRSFCSAASHWSAAPGREPRGATTKEAED